MSSHIHTHILAYSEVGRKRLQTTIYGTLAGKRGQILTHFSAYIPKMRLFFRFALFQFMLFQFMPENHPFLHEIAFSERVAFMEAPSPNFF